MDDSVSSAEGKVVELIDKGVAAIEAAIEKAGELGPQAWDMLVYYERLWGWSLIIPMCLILLATVYFDAFWLKKMHKNWKECGCGECGWGLGFVAGLLISIFMYPICLVIIIDGIRHILVPEYYAAMKLLQFLR